MAFVVGLTGGIGSGKTTVADLFAELGAGLVDTDEISRELTSAGQAATGLIANQFGPEYLTSDGALDRGRMRSLVFSDAAARRQLEAILHPLIRTESRRQVAASRAPYVIVVVPLLLEGGHYRDLVRRVLVVDCDPELQIRRVMTRSGLTREEVAAIIATQVSRNERLKAADDIIVNDGRIDDLRAEVARLHRLYSGLAAG
jgi:dephospho-CoA kinase